MDRLWRKDIERQGGDENRIEEVVFDPALVKKVGKMENVLSEFLDEQMAEVEAGLRQQGMEKPDGIPLEILFTLVTEDGTKRNRELSEILGDLPKNRKISEEHVRYCMDKFHEIKLLRSFAGE